MIMVVILLLVVMKRLLFQMTEYVKIFHLFLKIKMVTLYVKLDQQVKILIVLQNYLKQFFLKLKIKWDIIYVVWFKILTKTIMIYLYLHFLDNWEFKAIVIQFNYVLMILMMKKLQVCQKAVFLMVINNYVQLMRQKFCHEKFISVIIAQTQMLMNIVNKVSIVKNN